MTARPSPPRCKCGCGAIPAPGNSAGFASAACWHSWQQRQRPVIDDARITALRRNGANLAAVAKAVGRSKASVARRLRELGVKPERAASTERSHKAGEVVAPGRHYTKSLQWARIGSYRHPALGHWAFGCQVCSRHILGPMVEGMPAWKGQRL